MKKLFFANVTAVAVGFMLSGCANINWGTADKWEEALTNPSGKKWSDELLTKFKTCETQYKGNADVIEACKNKQVKRMTNIKAKEIYKYCEKLDNDPEFLRKLTANEVRLYKEMRSKVQPYMFNI